VAAVGDLQTLPDVEPIEGIDEAPACQSIHGCDRPADWMGRGRCPHCGRSLVSQDNRPANFICHSHLTAWLTRIRQQPLWICACLGELVHPVTLMTWQSIR
jgi:hypothetical protein